jgi:hypothetical protein
MLDLLFYTLLAMLAALLFRPAREIYRSLRRRRLERGLFRHELLVAREGTIRHEGGRVYVRLASIDDRAGGARVVAGAAAPWGRRRGPSPSFALPPRRKEGC